MGEDLELAGGSEGAAPDPFDPFEASLAKLRKLWHKRATTPLDQSERAAWGKNKTAVAATTDEQWELLAWWRSADEKAHPDTKFRRSDMATHLNNWGAEIDRAGEAARKYGVSFKKKTAGYPADWKERIEREFTEANLPRDFGQLEPSMQAWVLEDWRKNL